ncbi:MAG TPA: (4Fe-4S)-binding protein, partial [Smithellaceae bacterium]|nr:(4Fe-4S)-binding protein [Smithellaceae bacterium]
KHFQIPAAVCVNKWDINPEMTERIEGKAIEADALIAGRIRYDSNITRAQIQQKTVVEISAPSAEDIIKIWDKLNL